MKLRKLLSVIIDALGLFRTLFADRPDPPEDAPEVCDDDAARSGTVAGAAAYESSKRAQGGRTDKT